MFKNYLKIAIRNLKRHKGFSFINITGLAIGLACTILILLWIQNELSYDKFHEHCDQIYRIIEESRHANGIDYYANTPIPLAPELTEKFPAISNSTRFINYEITTKCRSKIFKEERVCITEPSFFEIFSFPFIEGDKNTALSSPYSIVLTESISKKYFSDENPVSKTLIVDNKDQFQVTGIIRDIPPNSHLEFDVFLPFTYLRERDYNLEQWDFSNCQTYILLKENIPYKQIEQKIYGLKKQHIPERDDFFKLQPLKQIGLYALDGGWGMIKYVYIFSIIALFILIIACINFVNLSTARSGKRAREVGLRKVVGAKRPQIIGQFFGESILLAMIALIIALAIVSLLHPVIPEILNKQLIVNTFDYRLILGLLFIIVVTGLFSGSYPALFLSSFKPVRVLKRDVNSGSKNPLFRKGLVIFQFSLSIMLITSTVIISKQIKYIHSLNPGYNKENLLYIPIDRSFADKSETFKRELLQNPNIKNATATFQLPSFIRFTSEGEWDGKNPDYDLPIHVIVADFDYIETLQLKIAQGRNFSKEYLTDSVNYIFNEQAIRKMGLTSPIGKRFTMWGIEGEIIGITEDFNFMPLNKVIEPIVIKIFPTFFRYLIVRIKPDEISNTIAFIENVWNTFAPDYPFEYHFLDEQFEEIYQSEQRMGTIFRYFMLLATFISCLGLFGLASFMAEQRTKEIGVRKVLGASIPGLILLFSKEFTKWILIANLVALPLAYLIMNNWLQTFAYRTTISLWIFILSATVSIVIALITVSYQSVKVALANPVES
ncbi:MAG: ABC transporter permease, partial [bacterium]